MPRQRSDPDRATHRRAIDRSPEEMRRCMASGGDPNGQGVRGRTPLAASGLTRRDGAFRLR